MRFYFLLYALVLVTFSGIAQLENSAVDQRLLEVYSTEQIANMTTNQPQSLAYLNYYVKNAYQVLTDIPESKWIHFKDISEINYSKTGEKLTAADFNDLNILKLDIVRKQEEYLTYRVGETGTVIVFIAPRVLIEQFNSLK